MPRHAPNVRPGQARNLLQSQPRKSAQRNNRKQAVEFGPLTGAVEQGAQFLDRQSRRRLASRRQNAPHQLVGGGSGLGIGAVAGPAPLAAHISGNPVEGVVLALAVDFGLGFPMPDDDRESHGLGPGFGRFLCAICAE